MDPHATVSSKADEPRHRTKNLGVMLTILSLTRREAQVLAQVPPQGLGLSFYPQVVQHQMGGARGDVTASDSAAARVSGGTGITTGPPLPTGIS